MKNRNQGITLIALVITIIILLILAGVVISSITGKDGMFAKINKAKNENNYSVALEKIKIKIMEYNASVYTDGVGSFTLKGLAEYLGNSKETEIILKEYNKLAYTELEEIPDELNTIVVEVVGYEEYQFLIGKECTVIKFSSDDGKTFEDIKDSNNGNNNAQYPTPQQLASQVQVGDYVAYNALSYDDEGNAYSYISQVGTGAEHGNGYKVQTHTTNSNIKWRVLSKNALTGEVTLISEKPIMIDENGYPFYMLGAIAYLYQEEELNRICSIYGHGYGANTDKVFTCQTGEPVEGMDTVTLTGSGARSINADDINDITGFDKTDNTRDENGGAANRIWYL